MGKYKFGKASMERYHTLKPLLQKIAWQALNLGLMDFAIACGHRNKEDQDRAFQEGRSKVRWPDGKHNEFPSGAMDLAPYVNGKISWNYFHCCVLAGIVLATAKILGVDLRWGGDWNCSGDPVTGQEFNDLVHFELIG